MVVRGSYADWGCYYGGSFRMKKTLVRLDSNRETIIVMMRYGGAIDQIAEELGYSEQELVEYIKSSGLDKQLSRRSWKWKAGEKRKRNAGTHKRKKNAG